MRAFVLDQIGSLPRGTWDSRCTLDKFRAESLVWQFGQHVDGVNKAAQQQKERLCSQAGPVPSNHSQMNGPPPHSRVKRACSQAGFYDELDSSGEYYS